MQQSKGTSGNKKSSAPFAFSLQVGDDPPEDYNFTVAQHDNEQHIVWMILFRNRTPSG
jgi:hypothetical protein